MINFSVFPLEDVAKVCVPQKCLLPAVEATDMCNNGTWARCAVQVSKDDNNLCYIICQVYQRKSLKPPMDYAYLDRAVTVGITHEQYMRRLHGAVLCELQPLTDVLVDNVEVTFIIGMDFFSKPRRTNLVEIAKVYLQNYCLTNGCTVRSQTLHNIGIVAINVQVKTIEDERQCFSITDETCIQIADVQLYTSTPSFGVFHTVGYEAVIQELNNLINRYKYGRWLTNSHGLLVGPAGCGKSAVISHFVQQNHCNHFYISMETVLGQYPGESESKLREIFAAARTFVTLFKPKAPTIIHLEDLHLLCPAVKVGNKDAGNSLRLCAQLNLLLDSLNSSELNITCLATTSDSKLVHKSLICPGRFQHEINIEAPDDMTRRSQFRLLYSNCLHQETLTEEILHNVVTRTSGYVIADLAMIVRSVEQAFLHRKEVDMPALISEILAKTKPASIRNADVSVIKSDAGFESIGGMQSLKNTLKLNVLTGLTRAKAFERFRLSLPKGILLYGPPGCAKTTIAKCLAAEANMTFIATSGAEVYSPYVGCAEKFIIKLFDTARKHAPSLLFLDEIDTLVGCRALGMNASDVQTRILSTLLTEMDGIVQTRAASEAYILVIAATNRPHMIDDALLRPGRFDQLIHVPAPDRESRFSILELHKKRMPFAADCNLLEIVEQTQNFSGADICNLCNEAAMHTLLNNMDAIEITKAAFDSVLRTQKPSLSQQQIDSYFQFEKGKRR